MTQETYKGRRLRVVKANGGLVGSINGQPMPTRYGVTEQEVIAQFHRDIDHVDQAPVDGSRWGAYMYAPGTYELCDNAHPKAIGEPCRHGSCQQAARPMIARDPTSAILVSAVSEEDAASVRCSEHPGATLLEEHSPSGTSDRYIYCPRHHTHGQVIGGQGYLATIIGTATR